MKNKYLFIILGVVITTFFGTVLLIKSNVEIPSRYIPLGLVSGILITAMAFVKVNKSFDGITTSNPLKKKSRTIG